MVLSHEKPKMQQEPNNDNLRQTVSYEFYHLRKGLQHCIQASHRLDHFDFIHQLYSSDELRSWSPNSS